MSGTNFGATSAQEQSFISTWFPWAEQAASQIGVATDTVLAQWAVESGWGTNTGASADNNPGALMDSTGNALEDYSSPSAFVSDYVSTIDNNFSGAVNSGSDVQQFVSGLTNGKNGTVYFGNASVASGYQTAISDISAQLSGTNPTATGTGSAPVSTTPSTTPSTSTNPTSTSTTTTAATPAGGASTNGVTAGWLSGLLPNVLIMALGLGVAYIGFSRTSVGGTVINTGKSAAKMAVMA